MADLFEGAPPEWIQATGEGVNNFLNNKLHAKALFDWIENKAFNPQAYPKSPEIVNRAGDIAYKYTTLPGMQNSPYPGLIDRAIGTNYGVAAEPDKNKAP